MLVITYRAFAKFNRKFVVLKCYMFWKDQIELPVMSFINSRNFQPLSSANWPN